MTLGPGETAKFELDLREVLGPDLIELISRGEVTMEALQGPQVETEPGHFHKSVQILIDGKPHTECVMTWQAEPVPVWRMLVAKFHRWLNK